MNNTASLGITSVIILIAVILIALTTLSVMSQDTTDTSEEEIDQIINDAIDPLTKYIQITDRIGKYYGEAHNQKIQKIAIMIKPLVSDEIDISQLTIKIDNGENVRILTYDTNTTTNIGTNNLFEHPVWGNLTGVTFGIITTHDKDNSITNYNTLNKNTDMAYLIIKLPTDYYMKKDDTLTIKLFPESGYERTLNLEAPLPMKKVVTL